MNPQQLREAQEHILATLRAQEPALELLRISPLSLIEKWQKFLGIILPIQLDALRALGLGSEQADLSQFNKLLLEQSLKNPELKALNEQKWAYLFEKAFGLTELRSITLEQARALTEAIVHAMTSEEFLTQVDHAISKLSQDSCLVERRQALLKVLLPLHMSVMVRHGFEGEEGYVQAQRALMDYYYDPEIMNGAQKAQTILFTRAKLIPAS